MKTREDLLTEIFEEDHDVDRDDIIHIAVDATTYAALEYIDDAIEQFQHYDVLVKVLKTLRSNIAELGAK